ncbi:TolC family protein [Neolewinella maritima]|uniref:TolC family protein n=1 Tax=Neolewinella maritima TaxID=1383882 RepID=UPI001EE7C705|nr:TolC family protein [Neolewinella maritima]
MSAQATLTDYLDQARLNSPQLTDYRNQQRIAELEIERIGVDYRKPKISLTGDVLFAPYLFNNRRVFSVSNAPTASAIGYDAGVTNGGLYAALIGADYRLFTERLSAPEIDQQLLARSMADNQVRLSGLDLERQVTANYLSALLVQEQLRYQRELLDRLADQRELVRKLADRGVMRVTDLELLNLEVGRQRYLIADLELQYRQALQTLNATVGSSDTGAVSLLLPRLDTVTVPNSSAFTEAYRLDSLRAANDQALFATRYLPQVSTFANGGVNAVSLNNIQRKVGVSAGLRLSWLLLDGGQRGINRQENEIRRQTAARYADFTQQQQLNYRDTGVRLLARYADNLALLDRQLDDYERVLATYRREFAMGQLGVIEYLNVIRSYADLQQQRNQLTVQRLQTLNELNYWNH